MKKSPAVDDIVVCSSEADAAQFKVVECNGRRIGIVSTEKVPRGLKPAVQWVDCSILSYPPKRKRFAERLNEIDDHPILVAIDKLGTEYGLTAVAHLVPKEQNTYPSDVVRVSLNKQMGDVALWLEFHANAQASFVVELIKATCLSIYEADPPR